MQFLPDVDVPCPACRGSRYAPAAFAIRRAAKAAGAHGTQSAYTLPEFMDMDVSTALRAAADMKTVSARLRVLEDLGLGYLTLGEATPRLSGGEAQRLKLAGEMGRGQDDALFVFDEPTIGLHPENVATLMAVFERLVEAGATVIVIEHDLDVIRLDDRSGTGRRRRGRHGRLRRRARGCARRAPKRHGQASRPSGLSLRS